MHAMQHGRNQYAPGIGVPELRAAALVPRAHGVISSSSTRVAASSRIHHRDVAAEQQARARTAQSEAKRAEADAELHEARAELHDQGLADDEIREGGVPPQQRRC